MRSGRTRKGIYGMEDSEHNSLPIALGAGTEVVFKDESKALFCIPRSRRSKFPVASRAIPSKSIAPISGNAVVRICKPSLLIEPLKRPHAEPLDRQTKTKGKITRAVLFRTSPPTL